MTLTDAQIQVAQRFIHANVENIRAGANEDVIRQGFTSYLRQMFPENPNWLERHIGGGESTVRVQVQGADRMRFIDNLVGLTTIEYEPNLTNASRWQTGYGQVREHCAGLINRGEDPTLILGVLSDTIRWHAYSVASIDPAPVGQLQPEQVHLRELESIDISAGAAVDARRLLEFLQAYLGRLESRPLTAESLRQDLGFDSAFCRHHLTSLYHEVGTIFDDNPGYSQLVSGLWNRFVDIARTADDSGGFEFEEYVDELYLVTLSKLICANVMEQQALLSTADDLARILDGRFFADRGLVNLVEYDYFGWLNSGNNALRILPIAEIIQEDLRAYNFRGVPPEDIFGQIMAQLARKSRRILLGQEWTPRWLAERIVSKTQSMLAAGEAPRFIDMCCGSGAMIVAAVRHTMEHDEALTHLDRVARITETITGFDIDPLAVMLAKINWVVAARDWLVPFGTHEVTIPIYQADSLFAHPPLASDESQADSGSYDLHLGDQRLSLPGFLISPQYRSTFDALLDAAHRMMIAARPQERLELEAAAVRSAASQALVGGDGGSSAELAQAEQFVADLAKALDRLDRQGRNGIWTFVLRNSYRPGLMEGHFNGIVSNPPWLALSKLAENPFKNMLRQKATELGIRPTGPAFLHVEMATIFLLHSIRRYLAPGGIVGCIIPETILSGAHHEPFRSGRYQGAEQPVEFTIENVWLVESGTFSNNAVVLFGTRTPAHESDLASSIAAATVGLEGGAPTTLYRRVFGTKSTWTTRPSTSGNTALFEAASFRQGADIMPRTLFFHEVTPVALGRSRIAPIDIAASPLGFVIKDAKKFKQFRIAPRTVSNDVIFDVLTSNLVTPFSVAAPLKALLPIRRDTDGSWIQLSEQILATKGAGTIGAFDELGRAIDSDTATSTLWSLIDVRRKLSQQRIIADQFLVLYGAGGSIPCAAHLQLNDTSAARLIIDQTLYWTTVTTEEEALYLVGLFNSQAVKQLIEDYQARGLYGARHIHKLPIEMTPPYDPDQAAHQEVVSATRVLLDEFESTKPSLVRAMDPNGGPLAQRRTVISRALRSLEAYPAYDLACRAVYDID